MKRISLLSGLALAVGMLSLGCSQPALAHGSVGIYVGVPPIAGIPYANPYYAPPIYAAPPVYSEPPTYSQPPEYYSPVPRYETAPPGYTCVSGPYTCPLTTQNPINSPCTCPTNNGYGYPLNGYVR
jgi:hypothetical protein